MEILYKAKGDPGKKPRIWFTCHPDDMAQLDPICQMLWQSHVCAIYYTDDMTAPVEDLETDIGSNNLLVVPVTRKLLTTPNRAMDEDIPFALREHIPILPLMLELGLDPIYSRPDKFGELQYLCPNATDETAISFPEKLHKYLNSVLVSDETAQRIRKAFDAYIFLSYRKKDRRYANELMRLIHKDPRFQSIAIWFDEFLTPGESFRESIQKILASSKLFTLLVTPNLLEEGNYVMTTEYPEALKSGIPILPAQMEETDVVTLSEKYPQLPDCIDPQDNPRLADALEHLVKTTGKTAEHLFLTGLAYLSGIDVETDRGRGVELITKAAEAEFPEAIENLATIYLLGIGIPIDYQQAAFWAEKLVAFYERSEDRETSRIMAAKNLLAGIYLFLGKFNETLEMQEQLYTYTLQTQGEATQDTMIAGNTLASIYIRLGRYNDAERLLDELCHIALENDLECLSILVSLLTQIYSATGRAEECLEIQKANYDHSLKMYGLEHPYTANARMSLADIYLELNKYEEALTLLKDAPALTAKAYGPEHPAIAMTMVKQASAYKGLGEHAQMPPLLEKAYTLQVKILGEDHNDSLIVEYILAMSYVYLQDYQQALPLLQKSYERHCRFYGQNHEKTRQVAEALIVAYSHVLDDYKKEKRYQELLPIQATYYRLHCQLLGQEHNLTIDALNELALALYYAGQLQEAHDLFAHVYVLRCKTLGAEHKSTITTQKNLAFVRSKLDTSPSA